MDGPKKSAACVTIVHVNAEIELKVTDVIEFDDAGLIKAVRAYKG